MRTADLVSKKRDDLFTFQNVYCPISRNDRLGLFTSTYSEKNLLDDIRKGDDRKALSVLYKEALPMVKAYVLKNQGSEDEAKDIFQEAVLRFYKSVREGNFQEQASAKTYLMAICKNLWINYVKNRNRQTGLDGLSDVSVNENRLESILTEEKNKVVSQLMEMLGTQCRDILHFIAFEELSLKEVAVKCGISSEEVVKTYHYRCKQKMMKLISERPEIMQLFRG